MIIQYCSDLHLEFPENKRYLKENPIQPKGDILLLAGDIVLLKLMDRFNDFWDYLSENFRYTYWIPGNHEYYYSDISDYSGSFKIKIRDNVFLCNNTSVVLDGTKLVFTTLWSKISVHNRFYIQQRLSDFSVIQKDGMPFTPDDYNQLHNGCLSFLKEELQKNECKKTVVVTHHVPTMQHYPERYRGDVLNEAFVAELDDLIARSDIDYWIFGHHHEARCDFYIEGTRMLSSQLGYIRNNEHLGFIENAYFNI